MESKDKVPKNKKKEKTYVPKTRVKKEVKKKYCVILVKPSALIISADGNGVQIPKGKEHANVAIGDEVYAKI